MSVWNRKLLLMAVLIATSTLSLPTWGAELFRKQSGTVTLPPSGSAASVTVTIEAVCMTQSFLVFSTSLDNNETRNFHVGGQVTNATTLTFTRFNNSTPQVTIKWQVFEFEGNVSVQRGVTSVSTSPANVTITAVDLTKTFVIATMSNDGTIMGSDDGIIADLTSTTNLQLSAPGTNAALTAYWQVIQYQDAVVKKFTTTLNAGTATTTTTIAPAITTLAKAMVIGNHSISADANSDDLARTELTNTTTVTYTRVGTTATLNFVTYVIEFTDLTTVTRGTQAFASGATSQNVAITAGASSGVFGPGNGGKQGSTSYATDDNTGHAWFTYEITSSTNLLITRAVGTGSTANAPYQIVTFEDQNASPRTFYTFASGAWESNASWTLTSDGSSGAVGAGVYPRRTDNVVIRSGHTITVNAVTDNGLCGLSPDNLSRANVGAFTGSADLMFYHIGDILISAGGTLNVTEEIMIEGYTFVNNGGTFSINEDIVNLGYLEIAPTGVFTNTDDLILSGNSITIINNTATGADDIYLDWTNATLCGDGTMNLGNGGADPNVVFFNGASIAQICSGFTLTCTANCGAFPITPTGTFSDGITGPGGVEATNGTGNLTMWLRAATINQSDNTNVTSWQDQSGYANHANAVGGNEPVYRTAVVNNQPVVRFITGNTDYLRVTDAASLRPSRISIFIAGMYNTASFDFAPMLIKATNDNWTDGYAIARNGTANNLRTYMNVWNANFVTSNLAAATNTLITSVYTATDVQLYYNEVSQGTDPFSTNIANSNNFLYLGIGPNPAGTGVNRPLDGDMAEVVIINRTVTAAERILIHNYLSAKYDISIAASANDVYTMDDVANGHYDFEVSGIGQAADGTNRRDAQGTGVVRMWNPSGLGNSEFLMWGHDNTTLTNTTTAVGTDVDGTIIEERLSRIWRVGETGSVGTVSVSFDLATIGTPLGSNLRLLIDRDGDGFADNDVTPATGSYVGSTIVFPDIDFQNGDRFTLGNSDSAIPLPIELIHFEASVRAGVVTLTWATESELSNDFFTVERSRNGERWESVLKLPGSGTTSQSHEYAATDDRPYAGISYYRLKQTDFDGISSHSSVVRVMVEEGRSVTVHPNPTTDTFTVSASFTIMPDHVKLFDCQGRSVPIKVPTDLSTNTEMIVDAAEISPGLYILQVSDGLSVETLKVVKR